MHCAKSLILSCALLVLVCAANGSVNGKAPHLTVNRHSVHCSLTVSFRRPNLCACFGSNRGKRSCGLRQL